MNQCRRVKELMKSSKMNYYAFLIKENKTDLKVLFNTIDRMLYRVPEKHYPTCSCTGELCNTFADFFHGKIETIRHKLDTLPRPHTSEFERLENIELACELHDLSSTSGIVSKIFIEVVFFTSCPSLAVILLSR